VPERGEGFVIVERVGQEVGIDEDTAEDGEIPEEDGYPREINSGKLPSNPLDTATGRGINPMTKGDASIRRHLGSAVTELIRLADERV
jgi:hypothetical protein